MFTKSIAFILVFTAAYCGELVRIDLYYINLCPGCMDEYAQLPELTSKLADYIDLHAYPIRAKLVNNSDGVLSVSCNNERDCYGNRIHQCATESLVGLPTPSGSPPLYIEYNNCVMQNGSHPASVDECAKKLNVPEVLLEEIKVCIDGLVGKYLQIKYALIRKRDYDDKNQKFVPYLVINGKKTETQDLMKTVCGLLKNPPPACSQHI